MFQLRRVGIMVLALASMLILAFIMAPAFSAIRAQTTFNVEADVTSATVEPRSGIVTVTGTVTCTEPATVFLSVNVRQLVGRFNSIFGFSSTQLECTGVTPFTLMLQGQDGVFKPGEVRLHAFVSGCVTGPYPYPGPCDFDQLDETLRLRVTK